MRRGDGRETGNLDQKIVGKAWFRAFAAQTAIELFTKSEPVGRPLGWSELGTGKVQPLEFNLGAGRDGEA